MFDSNIGQHCYICKIRDYLPLKCTKCNKDNCMNFWFRWLNLGMPCSLFQTKNELTILFMYLLFKLVTMIFAFYFSWTF